MTLENVKTLIATAKNFVVKYISGFGLLAIAIRQFIIGDWFGGIIALVIALILSAIEYFKK
jgi:hypothetical protein